MPATRTDDGVRLAYDVRGDGPLALLFMHGWAGSRSFWNPTFEHLDLAGLRAITFDWRGHGESDRPDGGFSHDRFAADAMAVLDASDAPTAVVVGYSMGARFAQYAASTHPDRVRGQVLIAGAPAAPIPLPPDVRSTWVACAGSRDRMRELESQFVRAPVPTAVMDRFLDDAAGIPAAVLDATLGMCIETSFVERLAGIEAPTLVVGGLHDPMFTPDVLRQGVAAPLRGARLALLDCGHDVPIEAPRELAAVLEAFLAGLH